MGRADSASGQRARAHTGPHADTCPGAHARAVAIVMGIGQALDKLDRPYTGSIKYLGAFTITPKDAA